MTAFERGIIDIVKSGISGCAVSLPIDFDWGKACILASKHQIIPIFYYGIKNAGLNPPAEVLSKLKSATLASFLASEKQMDALNKICKAFEKNRIDFMPLKGAILKQLYPSSEMRPMSDADILIKTAQYHLIKPILSDFGFVEGVESNHELVWNKQGVLFLELHKRLIPSYNKDYYAYFGDGWALAKPTDTSRYVMSDEDALIYMFTHYAKHYRDAGIGIRHLTDFKIFIDNKPDLNTGYIYQELEKLQLLEFYKNTFKTLDVWFCDAESCQITDFITTKIIGSGSYGTHKAHVMSSAVKANKTTNNSSTVKTKKFIELLFPPYSGMAQKYPFLKKWPVLLPAMWIARGFDTVSHKRGKMKLQMDSLHLITEENISEYQKELNYVGLDFNFEE